MSKKKRGGSPSIKIKGILENNKISEKNIEGFSEIDYPLFSFRYLHENSFTERNDIDFLQGFLMRLQKMSELGWKGIRQSNRHQYGMEKLPRTQLVVKLKNIPPFITPEVKEFHVFRSSGDKRTFVGFQKDKVFHIFFIEAKHGDICPH